MYKLSNRAADDFGSIYEYTWRQFGCEQADKYTHELDLFLNLLAKIPRLDAMSPKSLMGFVGMTIAYMQSFTDSRMLAFSSSAYCIKK